MELKLTKEQFKELVMATQVYSWIFGAVAEIHGKDFKEYDKIGDYLLAKAKEEGLKSLYEDFHGKLILSEQMSRELEKTIDEYNDDSFWDVLVTFLGKRDFWQTVTEEERKEIDKKGWLPERVAEFYDKYWEEFEKHGINRLIIKED